MVSASWAPGALVVILCSCSSPVTSPPVQDRWQFSSGFESASGFLSLFPSDLSQWTNVQCVEPNGTQSSHLSGMSVTSGLNRIELDVIKVASGTASLKFEAPPTGSSVSKASIAKEGVDFRPGDDLVVKFKVALEDRTSAENVFLFDLESTELPGYPGRRLALSSSQGLLWESKNSGGSYGSGPNFNPPSQSQVTLPKGQWVAIEVALHLARDGSGTAKVWQDGVLVVSGQGQTFPKETDITHFNWVEFGLTANSSPGPQTLWIDDIEMTRIRSSALL